jgi:Tfp pilus assembly protein PilF
MPEEAAKALPLLERALELEPGYALAHGFAAWAHEIIFARGGQNDVNREGATRHGQAAIAHGRDEASALALGGFAIGMMAHDRVAARRAFDAALALSPSSALTHVLGSVILIFNGEPDRAIEWGERAMRLSPLDPMAYGAWFAVALGYFTRGEHEAAAAAAQRIFQSNPYWSSAHFMLAATHVRLGNMTAARASAARVLELQPGFTISGTCAAFDIDPSAAEPLTAALIEAGLPE